MRLTGIDFLRGMAALGIVGCHLSLAPRTAGGNLVTALCDFNVGLFAAVAGFLMCGRSDGKGWLAYVGKRAGRLLPVYVIWSAVFILCTMIFDLMLDGGRLNPKYGSWAFWGRVVFLGDASTHLWFLICLFYAQILLWPAFTACARRGSGVVWVLLGGLATWAGSLSPGWFYRYPLRLAAFLMTGYGIGCLLQGGLRVACVKHNAAMWCSAALALALHVVVGASVPAFVRDWFAAVPVLLAFVGWNPRGRLAMAATFLGATSLGVYLVHPLIARGLSVVVSKSFATPFPAGVVFADWMIAWGMSLGVAFALRRVPVVRRIL